MSALPVCASAGDLTQRLEAGLAAEVDRASCIVEAARYALEGGQRLRARLLLEACDAHGPALQAAIALELLHGATLIQDDMLDRGIRRHGQPCTYLRFGAAHALLASDWLLVRALELAAEVDLRFFRRMNQVVREMICTEMQDVDTTAADAGQHAESAILQIAAGKTGGLFGLALYGAALLRGDTACGCEAAQRLGIELGTTYQLLDDGRDVYMSERETGKAVCQDLQAGRLTLPFLFGMEFQAAGQHPCTGIPEGYTQLRERLQTLDGRDQESLTAAVCAPEVRLRFGRWLRMRFAAHRRDACTLNLLLAVSGWEQRVAPLLAACCGVSLPPG